MTTKKKSKTSSESSKPLHLIIEGADGLGKTTLCELLSKELKLPVIKMKDMPKLFKKNPEEASEVFNKTVVQFKDSSFILDRGIASSIVYSKVYKRKYNLDYLSKILDDLNPVFVILCGDEPFRKDKLIDSEKWNEVNYMYQTFYFTIVARAIRAYRYVVEGETPESLCKQIVQQLSS